MEAGPVFVLDRGRSCSQSRRSGVAGTYAIFDMPTTCCSRPNRSTASDGPADENGVPRRASDAVGSSPATSDRIAPVHVKGEGPVDHRTQREVPLTDVPDSLAPGADLELDQPDVRVVRVEGGGGAAQAVNVTAGRQRVGDHHPLTRVGTAHLAPLGRRGAVRVRRVGADADHDACGDQVALVTGEVEPNALGVLSAQLREHGLDVPQPPRREAVTLGGVDVQIVERLQVLTDCHLDALLRRLLEVATPELVHAPKQVVLRLAGQRNLEGELWMPGAEAVLRVPRQPA